jgi:hypothetical protein
LRTGVSLSIDSVIRVIPSCNISRYGWLSEIFDNNLYF